MAIFHQFISVVIPIEVIEQKCKHLGGLRGVLELNKKWVGKKILVDEYLYKDGAMGYDDIDAIIDFWKEQGLVPKGIKNGKEYWKDLCVVDIGYINGITLPCEWIEYEAQEGGVGIIWSKGKPKGEIVVPDRLKKLNQP